MHERLRAISLRAKRCSATRRVNVARLFQSISFYLKRNSKAKIIDLFCDFPNWLSASTNDKARLLVISRVERARLNFFFKRRLFFFYEHFLRRIIKVLAVTKFDLLILYISSAGVPLNKTKYNCASFANSVTRLLIVSRRFSSIHIIRI